MPNLADRWRWPGAGAQWGEAGIGSPSSRRKGLYYAENGWLESIWPSPQDRARFRRCSRPVSQIRRSVERGALERRDRPVDRAGRLDAREEAQPRLSLQRAIETRPNHHPKRVVRCAGDYVSGRGAPVRRPDQPPRRGCLVSTYGFKTSDPSAGTMCPRLTLRLGISCPSNQESSGAGRRRPGRRGAVQRRWAGFWASCCAARSRRWAR